MIQVSKNEFMDMFLDAIRLETAQSIIDLRGMNSYMVHDLRIDVDRFTDAMATLATQLDEDLDISPLNEFLPQKISFWDVINGKFDNIYFREYTPITIAEAANVIFERNFES